MSRVMKISPKVVIGNGYIPLIAEIGLCHNGSVDIAKTLVQLAKDAGADIVKFQKRDVPNLAISSVLDAPDHRFPTFGTTYREVREWIEFDRSEYNEIFSFCREIGINATCTPFDISSLEFLKKYDLSMIKIASHSVTNTPLLHSVAEYGKPVLMSTGMCTLEEIDEALNIFKRQSCPVGLFHCVSSYPTDHEDANLGMISFLKNRYDVPVGLSTHERGTLATLAGVAAGADIIERHITLDHSLEGFDHKIALDPSEMRSTVSNIRKIESMLKFTPKQVSEKEMITRKKYRVSAVARNDLPIGHTITNEDILFKNPGTGIQPSKISEIVGKKVQQEVKKDELFTLSMVEN